IKAPLRIEQCQVINGAGVEARFSNIIGVLRFFHRLSRKNCLLVTAFERGEGVFDFLKRDQDGLLILRGKFFLTRSHAFEVSRKPATRKNWSEQARCERCCGRRGTAESGGGRAVDTKCQ